MKEEITNINTIFDRMKIIGDEYCSYEYTVENGEGEPVFGTQYENVAEEIIKRINEYKHIFDTREQWKETYDKLRVKYVNLCSQNRELTDMLEGIKEDFEENEFFNSMYVEICQLLKEVE